MPWRGGCAHRAAALGWVLARYASIGLPVIAANAPDGPWRKAVAVATGLEQTSAGVLVIADADAWAPDLPDAIRRVQDGAAWAMPHRGVWRLSHHATRGLLDTGEWLHDPSLLAESAYRGTEGGGITVVRHDVYETCPLDPRFAGWGQEDEAWGLALRTLHGPPARGHEALWHLWHPPATRASRARGSLANWELRKRYVRATGNPEAMRSLLMEAVCSPTC